MRWSRSVSCTVLLMLLGMLLVTASAVAGSVDWTALFAGEVVLETVQRPDGLPGLRASFAVVAPRERIWTVLLDYAHFPKIFPDIHNVRVLMNDQQGAQVEYWIKVLVSTYRYVLYRRYDEPGRRLTWTRVAGDLKRIEGSWEIHDTPRSDVQMLVYESYLDIGGVILRSRASRGMRKAREMRNASGAGSRVYARLRHTPTKCGRARTVLASRSRPYWHSRGRGRCSDTIPDEQGLVGNVEIAGKEPDHVVHLWPAANDIRAGRDCQCTQVTKGGDPRLCPTCR